MHHFTAEFGMGSGGSNALMPPGKLAGLFGVRVKTPETKQSFVYGQRVKSVCITGIYRTLVLYDQVSRTISTGKLHTLLHFHTQPINLVVYKGPYNIKC